MLSELVNSLERGRPSSNMFFCSNPFNFLPTYIPSQNLSLTIGHLFVSSVVTKSPQITTNSITAGSGKSQIPPPPLPQLPPINSPYKRRETMSYYGTGFAWPNYKTKENGFCDVKGCATLFRYHGSSNRSEMWTATYKSIPAPLTWTLHPGTQCERHLSQKVFEINIARLL